MVFREQIIIQNGPYPAKVQSTCGAWGESNSHIFTHMLIVFLSHRHGGHGGIHT